MDKEKFIKQIQKRVAQTSVGPSAIRNQGASGLITISRNYFEKNVDLIEFREVLELDDYKNYLNKLTFDLQSKFSVGGQSWGAARKALNLFFRDVVYNKYLADYLKIPADYSENLQTLKNLEIPLDKDVATGLNKKFDDLPKWTTIKSLDYKQSELFQDKALVYANTNGLARIHLDL